MAETEVEPVMVPCPECDGDGDMECESCGTPGMEVCSECDGSGEVEETNE